MSGGWLGPSDEEELEDLRAEQADARWKREREERLELTARLAQLRHPCGRFTCDQPATKKITHCGTLFYMPPTLYCAEHADQALTEKLFPLNYLVEDLPHT